jgi:hypothetical protein
MDNRMVCFIGTSPRHDEPGGARRIVAILKCQIRQRLGAGDGELWNHRDFRETTLPSRAGTLLSGPTRCPDQVVKKAHRGGYHSGLRRANAAIRKRSRSVRRFLAWFHISVPSKVEADRGVGPRTRTSAPPRRGGIRISTSTILVLVRDRKTRTVSPG